MDGDNNSPCVYLCLYIWYMARGLVGIAGNDTTLALLNENKNRTTAHGP